MPEDAATPIVASAAIIADPATRRRAESRSASVSVALTSAPATKPSWTEIVSHAVLEGCDESRRNRRRTEPWGHREQLREGEDGQHAAGIHNPVG